MDKMRELFLEKFLVPRYGRVIATDYADRLDTPDTLWATQDCWEAWQAARTAPAEAVVMLADVIRELENGFVRCETCGDQEDTATLDCMDDLRKIHDMLSAAPEGKK